MSIVDNNVLSALAKVERLDLLPAVFDAVGTPTAVIDEIVEEGQFGSRSDALRYGARLVTREACIKRFHELTEARAKTDVGARLERKRVPR